MKVCFNGCSFTVGEGFPIEQRDSFIYDRLVSKKFNFESDNIALSGSSNYKIFMRSVDAILSNKYDLVITQWSALNRVWLSPGPDSDFFTNDTKYPTFKYRDIHLSKEEKNKFKDTLLLLNHDFSNIIDLIKYCNILTNINNTKTQVIFVNGLVPWTQDIATPLTSDLSNCLSKYSKEILDFDNRDNDEIIKFFKILQDNFIKLDTSRWVNLFESFRNNAVDIGPEGHHPGPKSHAWMANKIEDYLQTKLYI
jgi:hypothetical protein